MSETDHVPGGLPDPGMVANGDGMRACNSWEMEQRPRPKANTTEALKAGIAKLEADIQRLQALLVCSSCATDTPGGPGVAVICRTCAAELQAIVDTLPKCNRLVDGVLVCDKRVTPGMVTFCGDRRPFSHQWDMRLPSGETYADHCKRDNERHFDSREAAEAARNER